MAIHTFANKEYGITAQVHVHVKGFSVTLKDDDADAYAPMVTICPDEAMAIKKAKELVA